MVVPPAAGSGQPPSKQAGEVAEHVALSRDSHYHTREARLRRHHEEEEVLGGDDESFLVGDELSSVGSTPPP